MEDGDLRSIGEQTTVEQSGAYQEPASLQSQIMGVVPLLLIFAVFYFLLIRPQQKRMKEHKQVLANLKKGDDVITSGGIIGVVSNIDDNDNTVRIDAGNNVQLSVIKQAISQVNPTKATDSDKSK